MAWQKGGFYTLVLDVMFAEPIIFDNIGDTLFLKSQSTYTFDLNSGAIHQIKYDLEDINGASVTVEQITYLERGYVDQLPQHAVQIMNEATNVVEKADQ
jgi:hypothetical protein